jgi:hypothetical protein
MANRKVSIWKSVNVDGKWRYCRPVLAANHAIKPNFVLVNGKPEEHKEGFYYVHFRQGTKQIWKKAGPSVAEAKHWQGLEESSLYLRAQGIEVKRDDGHEMLWASKIWPYLEEYKLAQRDESYKLMSQTLKEFSDFNKKPVLTDITRLDLLRYKQWLMNRGRAERTAGRKMSMVNQFLRKVQNIPEGKGLVTTKDARFVETEPEVYADVELRTFFTACSDTLRF